MKIFFHDLALNQKPQNKQENTTDVQFNFIVILNLEPVINSTTMKEMSLYIKNIFSATSAMIIMIVSTKCLAVSTGATNWFRKDLAFGLTGTSSFFDETNKNIFYQHTGLSFGLEADLRLGVRINILSLGAVGAYGVNWVNNVRQKSNGTDTYRHDVYQGLAGGFAAINIGAGKDSNEIIGEYYSTANQTVYYSDIKTENPYKANDSLKGKGWGVGVGGRRGDNISWIMYRMITFDSQNLDNVDSDLPSSTKKGSQTNTHSTVRSQSLTFMVGQSF